MKKFVNDVESLLAESLQGMAAAHGDLLALHLDPLYVTRKVLSKSKVALISGGGAGHEPLHCGLIGKGMLDAACPGQVFTSPTPDQMMAAAAAVDSGKGVLFIVKNYAGDIMNFQMAAEMMQTPCATVLVNDDVAVERSTHGTGRRGVAGTLIVEKLVGAAAEFGASLDQCKVLGDRVNSRTASMGVAFTSCTVPAAGRATFDIADNEMEFGVGIHGEPGRRRGPVRPAQELVDELMAAILGDLKPKAGSQVLLHVNGFGGTPLIELYLLYHNAAQLLEKQGIKVVRSLVGNYTTALEMAGASLTVTLMDDEMTSLWDAPVHTAALRW
ncbi:dihydroxyacetone kinase subunit DhaK [Ramlibacter sp. WS9]|uniref:dihydroxyacetone kinase subunit DhaK n=1 Tax=Ramlibacter sp. WS9 TaxID=1882741 RepID=UPI00114469C6|nr:dihydroxyacetone kinase subunit DhaK [Ramlibacter sp. WS9]ROZ66082.1 dihydroxyacetone kinase subunit DhaK [Ramlibacter sp. WS9]